MTSRHPIVKCSLFFWLLGSVCVASAIGAEQSKSATSPDGAGNALQAPANQGGGGENVVTPESSATQNADTDDNAAEPTPQQAQEQANLFKQEGGNDTDASNNADRPAQPASDSAGEGELPAGQKVDVGSFGQIDLHVKDLPLTKVLQLLSIQSQRNIVASRNVSGTISADLYGVGFYESLDAILHTNGFGYKEKGNFIYVYTQEELQQMEKANRKMVTKVVRLDYITANDASAFVSPMLSSGGSISVSGEPANGMQPSLNDAGANSYAHAATLVIRDYPENIERIMKVVDQLDKRPKQVLIEATILRASLSEENAFGVDFALFADLDVEDFTTPLGSVDDLLTGTGRNDNVLDSGGGLSSSPGQVASGQSSLKLGFMGSDAAVFVKALDSVTDTTVMATPKILVLNRQRADLLVGQRLGYLSTTSTDTSTTQTVEFLDIGTQLTVRPFVSDDGFIRIELRPSVSNGSTSVRGGFVVPNQSTQELTTNVMVESGQTVVLGGLFKEDTNIDRRQVPGLASVPVVGEAFKGQDDSVDRSEVIFLIKPTVLKDEKLYAAGERAQDTAQLTQVGAREGLLPWARSKLTHSHLKKAYQYRRKGNQDKALWHTNLALHANPTMVEALRLKEELSGQEMMVRDRGILQDAVDTMIDEQTPATQPSDDAQSQAQTDDASKATDDADAEMTSAKTPATQPAADNADADAETADADMKADMKADMVSDASEQASAQAQAQAESKEASDAAEASDNDAEMEAALQSTMDELFERREKDQKTASQAASDESDASDADEPTQEAAVEPASDAMGK